MTELRPGDYYGRVPLRVSTESYEYHATGGKLGEPADAEPPRWLRIVLVAVATPIAAALMLGVRLWRGWQRWRT